MKIKAIPLLIILSITKAIFSYMLIKYSVENPDNLILTLAQFGSIIGIFLTLLYFILLSYLSYIIATLIASDFEIEFTYFLNKWYKIGLLPMILCSLYLIIDFQNISKNIEFISIVNTITELFFFLYGTYIIYKKIKINIIFSVFSAFLPLIIFNLFKYVI